MMNDTRLFAFEDDFVQTLRCIPMAVRFKLDLAEVKVSLRQWSRFTVEDRRVLLLQPCGSDEEIGLYRQRLVALIAERTGEGAKPLPEGSLAPWQDGSQTPKAILAHAEDVAVPAPSNDAWRRLAPLERFVLLKLSRDKHDNVNFIPALMEFGLYDPAPSVAVSA